MVLGFIFFVAHRRIERINYISTVGHEPPVPSSTSPTGYQGGVRDVVLPDHEGYSYETIALTQQMLANREWRIRRIDFENAPFGREVRSTSPARWWLGSVAWLDHVITDRPLTRSVEQAALYANPLLHLLLVTATTLLVVRKFNAQAGIHTAIGLAVIFPFAMAFLPGSPGELPLAVVCGIWSVLMVLIGYRQLCVPRVTSDDRIGAGPEQCSREVQGWFLAAGVCGGFGLWVSVNTGLPLLVGIALGGILAAWTNRLADKENRAWLLAPWRAWSLGGSITLLLGYLVEYFPDHLASWDLRVLHPLYGIAWLGGGELLARAVAAIQRRSTGQRWSNLTAIVSAMAAVLAVPGAMWIMQNQGFLTVDVHSFRLTPQPDAVMAPNTVTWLANDGITRTMFATLIPLLSIGAALWCILRRSATMIQRTLLVFAMGPVLISLVAAFFYLRWWQIAGGNVLVLITAITYAASENEEKLVRPRWGWAACALLVFLPGVLLLIPSNPSTANKVLGIPEVESLVERDLAHWLAMRGDPSTPAVILAPPTLTTTLAYYGGLHGLGTLSAENKDGLSFAVRIVISTSREESLALLRRRGVTHIILPSWDNFFDPYISSASVQIGELFYTGLNRWALPLWLKPIPYQLPAIPGFESQSLRLFEVVDDQDEPMAASRLTEYFVEMGQYENAKASHQTLLKYPADFGVLIARAQLWGALSDAPNFTRVFEPLLNRLANGGDRNLPWDRRVSLAVVLARGNRMDLAGVQVQRCLAELSEARLRSLTTYSLYHLLVMNKALGKQIADPKLRELALALLPAELRQSI